jgi:predicted adenine nucleotide alpha hydrolase (AANH) superfamily ATPase
MSGGIVRPRLLLHACCAPCSTVPLERLHQEYDISVFFYGPNIHPAAEYRLRLQDQRRLCGQLGVELIEGPYRPADWGRAVLPFRDLPEGSERCEACYTLRMEETARLAREREFDVFTVTLTVSRHKNSKVLERIGNRVAGLNNVRYLAVDLKKKDGYNLSVRRSKEFGLRRQDYCGCSLSLSESRSRRRRKSAVGK